MRETKLVGLNHLQKGRIGTLATCYGFGSSSYDPSTTRNATTQGAMGLLISGDSKLQFLVNDTAGTTKAGLSQIPMSKFIDNRQDVTELTIGMLIDTGFTPSITNGYPLVGLHTSKIVMGSTEQTPYKFITQPAANTAAKSGYYEFVFTIAAAGDSVSPNKVDVYMDGGFISTIALPNGSINRSTLRSMYLTFGTVAMSCYGSANGTDTVLFTAGDIYAQYDTVLSDGTTRMGPIKIRPLPVASSNTPPWVASDGGTVLSVLNAADHHGTITTPYLTSDVAKTPLRLKPDVSGILDSETIIAVSGLSSASRDALNAASITGLWSYNGQVSASTVYLPTSGDWSTQKDAPVVNLRTMPDGTPITKAKLAALELVLTPTT